LDVFGLYDEALHVTDPVLDEGEKGRSTFFESVFPVLVGKDVSEVDLVGFSLNLIVFGFGLDCFFEALMKAVLPIKKGSKGVNIFPQRSVINIFIETELDSPPFRDILISLNGNNVEHLVSKGWDSEVGISAEDFSKGPFRF
jgi:hypothetical protein